MLKGGTGGYLVAHSLMGHGIWCFWTGRDSKIQKGGVGEVDLPPGLTPLSLRNASNPYLRNVTESSNLCFGSE